MENSGIQCRPAGMHGRQQNCAVYVHRCTKKRNKYRASGETEHEYVSFRKNQVSLRQNQGCCGFRPVFTAGNIVWLLMFVYLWGNAVYIYVPPIFRSPLPYLRGRLFGRCGGCLHSGCGTAGSRYALYARWGVCARREKRRVGPADTRFAGKTTSFEGTCRDSAIQNRGGEGFCRVA